MGEIFNDPIEDFGVLATYTGRRMREATGDAIDRIAHALSPRLRKVAGRYEKYTVELSNSCNQLWRRYGKNTIDRQHAQQRLADIAIDRFVGLCVLSRADSLEKKSHPGTDETVSIAEVFARQARRRMARNVRGLDRNEDAAIEPLAGAVLAYDDYRRDVVQARPENGSDTAPVASPHRLFVKGPGRGLTA